VVLVARAADVVVDAVAGAGVVERKRVTASAAVRGFAWSRDRATRIPASTRRMTTPTAIRARRSLIR
jgi:hypothetical protein